MRLEPLENRENLVQQLCKRPWVVQQVGDATEQVAEEIAGSWHRHDVEHDAAQVHLQTQQIQRQRIEVEMEDGAADGLWADDSCLRTTLFTAVSLQPTSAITCLTLKNEAGTTSRCRRRRYSGGSRARRRMRPISAAATATFWTC
jgi:hypothetical protein